MTHRLSRRQVLAYSSLTAATLAGCSGDGGGGDQTTTAETSDTTTAGTGDMTTGDTMDEPSIRLSVSDQEVESRTVTVPDVAIDGTGWLVVHPEADGGGPNGKVVLAKRRLDAGLYADQTLSLSSSISEDQTLYGMLHYDDPEDGEFTFPQSGDPPVKKDGSPVVKPFEVTMSMG